MSDFRKFLNVYEFDCVLPGSGKNIKFKPITTGQLKALLTYEGETDSMVIEEALDKLISSAIVTKNFDITDLYLQDRFHLLVEIRIRTKGNNYNFTHTCNNKECKSETLQSIDISKMKVKKLSKKVDQWVKVDNEITVKLSHIKRKHNIEAYETLKNIEGYDKMSATQKDAETTILTHAASIEYVKTPKSEEKPILLEKQFLLENVPTDGYDRVKKWYKNNDFGMDFRFIFKCAHCKKKETVNVPTEGFFV